MDKVELPLPLAPARATQYCHGRSGSDIKQDAYLDLPTIGVSCQSISQWAGRAGRARWPRIRKALHSDLWRLHIA